MPSTRDGWGPCTLEVLIDKRGTSTFEVPHAEVRLTSEERGQETIEVPAPVARALARDELDYPLSRDEVMSYVEQCLRKGCEERIVRLQTMRDYSSHDLIERLVREGYERGLAEACVEEARAKRIVNDLRYADAFCRKKSLAGWGMLRIERELKTHGVDVCELVGWPDEYVDPEEEYLRALRVAESKHVRGKDAMMRLARSLMQKGYSAETSYRAAREALGADD